MVATERGDICGFIWHTVLAIISPPHFFPPSSRVDDVCYPRGPPKRPSTALKKTLIALVVYSFGGRRMRLESYISKDDTVLTITVLQHSVHMDVSTMAEKRKQVH